ncbi:MAG: ATP-dependent Clp protease ATP-binding subunit ClpA, partial [Rhizobiaceae bacterium]
IQEYIKKPLADELLFGKLKDGGTVHIAVEKDEKGVSKLKLVSLADEAKVKPTEEPEAKAKPRKVAAKAKAKPAPKKVEALLAPAAKKPRSSTPVIPKKKS